MLNQKVIKEKYAKVKKEYPILPELDDLDQEIELIDFLLERRELPIHFLAATRRRFVDVVGGWINYLHNFLLPNQQSMILIHESGSFSDKEKEEVTILINQLMFMSRVSAKLELQKEEESDAKFIAKYLNKWLEMKSKILSITEKNISIWKEAMEKKVSEEKAGQYFG